MEVARDLFFFLFRFSRSLSFRTFTPLALVLILSLFLSLSLSLSLVHSLTHSLSVPLFISLRDRG